jgi:hypothetical protein
MGLGRIRRRPIWKSATQQVWKPAPPKTPRVELASRSQGDFATAPKNRKTYRRFLGTIFWQRVQSMQGAYHQLLARQQTPKKRKNAAVKCHFLCEITPFFCQTGSFPGRF